MLIEAFLFACIYRQRFYLHKISIPVTYLGQIFGSRGYLCHKYVDTGVYDAKAEIYSFGIVLLELLSGRLQGADREFFDLSDLDDIEPDPRYLAHVIVSAH